MATTPPLDFDHKKGFEIPTKHKEAIRQLYWFGKIPKLQLQERYHLGDTTIDRAGIAQTSATAYHRGRDATNGHGRMRAYTAGMD